MIIGCGRSTTGVAYGVVSHSAGLRYQFLCLLANLLELHEICSTAFPSDDDGRNVTVDGAVSGGK